MYLRRKMFIGNKYRKKSEMVKVKMPKTQNSAAFQTPAIIQNERINEISEEMGYWRKANQIHQWFVENVQNGEDDCGEYPVSIKQLEDLLKQVKKALVFKSLAPKILPISAGFFFGGTEYDKYYFQNLEDTKEIIETVLKENDNGVACSLYYSSSW